MKKKVLAVMLVIWMIFIFSMSSENGQQSAATSGSTIEHALSVVPEFEQQPEEVKENIVSNLQFFVRKSAHFFGYMILGILAIGLILQYKNINKKFFLAWGICIIYAMSDEIHQLFVPGRSGQIKDVLIDSAGSFLGIMLVMIFMLFLRKIKMKVNKN